MFQTQKTSRAIKAMDGHPGAPVRSRASQTPSPSASVSTSASATASSSVHHKRKFHATATPFSAPDAGALISNDDLDSVSAREDDEEDDTDDEDDEEEEVDEDDEEDENHYSMRTFTAARLDGGAAAGVGGSNSLRSAKPPKPELSVMVKVEPPSAVEKERGGATGNASGQQTLAATAGLIPGIAVKEDTVKGIFTENIQTSGAYSAREEGLKREEEIGMLRFSCYANDGIDEHMIWVNRIEKHFRETTS